MSLATSGAGGGMGGAGLSTAAMAHGGPNALSTHQATSQQSHSGPPPGTTAAAAPPNMAALGADLLDKNQNLNVRQIRNVAEMPIVALDLFGGDGGGDDVEVAMFPPKEKGVMGNKSGIIVAKGLGTVGSTLYARRDDGEGASHRALRRLLNKGKGFEAVFRDTLVDDAQGNTSYSTPTAAAKTTAKSTKKKPKPKDTPATPPANILTIPTPHLLLGHRNTTHLHPATAAKFTLPSSPSSPATSASAVIDEEDSNLPHSPTAPLRNGNLDGSTASQNNDYDRVTLNLQLHSDKKALSLLPEEAVGIVTARAKKMALEGSYDLSLHKTGDDAGGEEEESYLAYPTAIALPGWACRDNAIDSLSDACHGDSPVVLFQRSVAALAGALLPTEVKEDKRRKLVGPRVVQILEEKKKAQAKKKALEDAKKKEGATAGGDGTRYLPTVVLAGVTGDGVEYTAVQVGSPNNKNFGDGHCPMGEFHVVASVSYQHADPLSIAKKTLGEFTDVVDEIYPELEDDGGIASFITYGTIASQVKLKDTLVKALGTIQTKGEDGATSPDVVWNDKIPFSSTRDETVALGTALLAAVSYARIDGEPRDDNDNRMRPAITVTNVSPCAVGITYNFDGGRDGTKWTDPKVIFDYDRRVPTSAHRIDFSASECVAIRKDRSLLDDEEKLYDEAQRWVKGKYNAEREEAALDLRVQVVQRVERGGKWRKVGAVMTALTQASGEEEEGEDDDASEGGDDGTKNKTAVETSALELSLDSVGYIRCDMSSDGQSISQAVKSARSSSFWWYIRVLSAILFFGGFMVKSVVDERIRKYDVKKVLAFYKHVDPGSLNDGDERNAQYLCWKYKGKKNKLWKRLETKYGQPMREPHEWGDEEEEEEGGGAATENVEESDDEEEVDLDEDTAKAGGSDGDL